MKWKVLIVIGFILLILGGFYFLDPSQSLRGTLMGEPFYDGRPASVWEAELISDDPSVQQDAWIQLTKDNADSIPVLAYLLNHSENRNIRGDAAQALGRYGRTRPDEVGPLLVDALDEPDPIVRLAIALSLSELAPAYPEAVPALVELFPDPRVIRAVSKYKEKADVAIPALVPLLKSDDVTVRWETARTLGKIGPKAVVAVPELIAELRHDDALVREHAAEALGDIGPSAAKAIPDLVAVLDDEAWKVRRDAIRSLGKMGPAAQQALPAIRKLKQDSQKEVQDAVTTAERLVTDSDPDAANRRPTDEEND